jgi:hypothetical protein
MQLRHRTRLLTFGYFFVALSALLAPAPDSEPSALERSSEGWTDLWAESKPDLNGWTRGQTPPGGELSADSQWVFDPITGHLVFACKGKDVTLWVNGAVTNEWHGCEVPEEYVGLEAEGFRIEFRNVKVKPP